MTAPAAGAAKAIEQFTYLLNAMEFAAQANNPSKLGYGDKRQAVFDFIRTLAEGPADLREQLSKAADRQCVECGRQGKPTRGENGGWWHTVTIATVEDDGEDFQDDEECDSWGIHEALYQFDQAHAAVPHGG